MVNWNFKDFCSNVGVSDVVGLICLNIIFLIPSTFLSDVGNYTLDVRLSDISLAIQPWQWDIQVRASTFSSGPTEALNELKG